MKRVIFVHRINNKKKRRGVHSKKRKPAKRYRGQGR
jgi:hypothetical protein